MVSVRFVSLDCSHLGALAKDFYSRDAKRRELARSVLDGLWDAGWLLLISWHQFEELIKHRNDEVAAERVAFLRAQPHLAWISARSDPPDLGSIVDLFVSEIEVSLSEPGLDAIQVRDRVRSLRLKSGSGTEALDGSADMWMALRPLLWQREERAREIASITQADAIQRNQNARIGKFLQGIVRPRNEARRELERLRKHLVLELRQRGDEQLENADSIATTFVREVAEEGMRLRSAGTDPIGAYLRSHGIERGELDPSGPLKDMLDLIMFRNRLRLAERILNAPRDLLRKTISPDSIPSWVTERALIHHRARPARVHGSDVTDKYMLSASVYADLSLVDKRTKENHRRVVQKEPGLARLFNEVERAPHYETVTKFL